MQSIGRPEVTASCFAKACFARREQLMNDRGTLAEPIQASASKSQNPFLNHTRAWRAGAVLAFVALLVSSLPAHAATPGTWSPTANMRVARGTAPAVSLSNGMLLVIGGHAGNDFLASAE